MGTAISEKLFRYHLGEENNLNKKLILVLLCG